MTTLILTQEEEAVWTIPVNADVEVVGSAGEDSIAVSNGANLTLQGFSAGNDNIYIQGNSTDFTVSVSGSTVTFLSNDNTTQIKISAGLAGQALVFGNGYLDLGVYIDGTDISILCGTQIITSESAALTSSVDPDLTSDDYFTGPGIVDPGDYTVVSADIGSSSNVASLDAGLGSFKYADDATVANNVVINNFTDDDIIQVSNAESTDYKFSNDGADVTIQFNNGGEVNTIVLTDVVADDAVVANEALFEAAIGFDAFTVLGGGEPSDTTAPTLVSTSPADDATDITVSDNLVLTFDEDVVAGAGNFIIRTAADDTVVEVIAASEATFDGNTVTLDPAADLAAGTEYQVTVQATAVEDSAGNAFAGITDDSFTFTSATAEAAQVSLDTGTLQDPVVFDADAEGFTFTDDAGVLTNVIISNFTNNDIIEISGAVSENYMFTNDGEDVQISFNNEGIINFILLTGIVEPNSIIADEATFEAAIGFDAVNFA